MSGQEFNDLWTSYKQGRITHEQYRQRFEDEHRMSRAYLGLPPFGMTWVEGAMFPTWSINGNEAEE